MKWSLITAFFIAAISLVLLAAAPGAGKASDAPQKFNLADLADSESRTFGEGDHAITATRHGNDVAITYKGDGREGTRTIHCAVGKDDCYAMTFSGDGRSTMVMLSKTAAPGKEGQDRVVTKVVLADSSADPNTLRIFATGDEGSDAMVVGSDDSGMTWVTAGGEDAATEAHPGIKVLKIVTEGGTVLRCPEGDATLTLKKGEENTGPYFCPRHNLKMELSKEPVVISQKIKVEKRSGTRDEEY